MIIDEVGRDDDLDHSGSSPGLERWRSRSWRSSIAVLAPDMEHLERDVLASTGGNLIAHLNHERERTSISKGI